MSDTSEKKPVDRRKQSLYFPEGLLAEISADARRLDRSLSWLLQKSYRLAKEKIAAMPSVNEPGE